MLLANLAVLLFRFRYCVAEVGRGNGQRVYVLETRQETAPHDRAVLERDVVVAEDRRHAGMPGVSQHCQRRREKEERNAALAVEVDDLREDRERRVVDDGAAVWIVKALVVTAGEERTDNFAAFERVALHRPCADSCVHVRRREAVVGRALRLELLDEALVVCVSLFSFVHVPSPLSGAGFQGMRRAGVRVQEGRTHDLPNAANCTLYARRGKLNAGHGRRKPLKPKIWNELTV